VNTRKDKKTPPSSDAALPIPAGAAVPAPFVAKDVPAQTVAYAFWRGDVFRGFKVIPSIEAWAEKNGWTVSGALTEVYVTSTGKDPTASGEHLVEVRLPVSPK
jgi:effector-binding domain-containing protein